MSERMTEPGSQPTEAELRQWLGTIPYRFWEDLEAYISSHYPSVFKREWLFGGKKHGWSLRYKKSKSFCTLIPEKNDFKLLIVFGEKERTVVEQNIIGISMETANLYHAATTYHDGKWLLLSVDNRSIYNDIIELLILKKKPFKYNK